MKAEQERHNAERIAADRKADMEKDPFGVKATMEGIVEEERRDRQWAQDEVIGEQNRIDSLERLIGKFLDVMANEGNPGTQHLGLWRGEGWVIAYEFWDSTKSRYNYRIFVTTKGRLYARCSWGVDEDKWKPYQLGSRTDSRWLDAESSIPKGIAEVVLDLGLEWPEGE